MLLPRVPHLNTSLWDKPQTRCRRIQTLGVSHRLSTATGDPSMSSTGLLQSHVGRTCPLQQLRIFSLTVSFPWFIIICFLPAFYMLLPPTPFPYIWRLKWRTSVGNVGMTIECRWMTPEVITECQTDDWWCWKTRHNVGKRTENCTFTNESLWRVCERAPRLNNSSVTLQNWNLLQECFQQTHLFENKSGEHI